MFSRKQGRIVNESSLADDDDIDNAPDQIHSISVADGVLAGHGDFETSEYDEAEIGLA